MNSMNSMKWLYVITFAVLCIRLNHGAITLRDKGYSGIVVGLAPTLSKEEGTPLIDRIKELFTNASSVLYEATHGRAYFKDVTILVPKTWINTNYGLATFETYRSSDIRIDVTNSKYGDAPYALQNRGCGYPGLYIHLTPSYLLNLHGNSSELFGDPAKTLVHEWAHYRYGVFDEFGLPGNKNFPMFYYQENDLTPNYCANDAVEGTFRNFKRQDGSCSYGSNGLPDKDCVFIPYRDNNKPTTNLNSYHYLPNVKHFCNDSNHNKLAPNKHNRVCKRRSSWDVIVKNEDFKTVSTLDIKNFEPNFKIVQQSDPTFVLVLDLSTTMNEGAPVKPTTRLTVLADTVKRWLQDEVKDGWSVGIVTFSDSSKIAQSVVKIENQSHRQLLLSKVPTSAGGYTCIGCGLKTAVDELKKFRNGPGGTIILISDGQENRNPLVKDVLPNIVAAGIRVISIAISQATSPALEDVSRQTGGKTYFVSDKNALEAMGSAFYDVVTQQESDEETIMKLSEKVFSNPTETFLNNSFVVDSGMGNETTVNIIYNGVNVINEITILTRNQTVLIKWPTSRRRRQTTKTKDVTVTHDTALKQIRIQFPYLQPGSYGYSIKRNSGQNQGITVNVLSKSKSTEFKPIVTRCWMAEEKRGVQTWYVVYAEVKKGNFPIIKAAVYAKVDRPDGTSVEMQLWDNGNVPDIEADDGIYSKYFTMFSGKGRYTVKANVLGNNNSSIVESGFTASRSPPIFNEETMKIQQTKEVQTGDFERTTDGGSINIPTLPTTDIYPPIEVDDLIEVFDKRDCRTSNNKNDCFFTFQWTAPGDDLDDGQAKEYDLRYSDNENAFLNDFTNGTKIPINKTPLIAREIETVKVPIMAVPFDKNIFFAMKAVDNAGLWSDVSNILTIRIASPTTTQPPTTTALPTTTEASTTASNSTVSGLASNTTVSQSISSTETSSTSSTGEADKQGSGNVSLTVGLIVGVLVVVTIAAGVVWFLCNKK